MKIINFDDTEAEKYEFYQHKSCISINDIDINEIIVSKKFSFCKQDFKTCIGNKEDKEIRPLSVFFLKLSLYKKYSGKNKCIYFMIKD